MQDFEIWMFIAVFQEMLGWAIWPIAAFCVLATLALGLVLPRLEAPWISPRLAEAVRLAAPGLPDDRFGVVGYHEPSLLFAMGGEIRLLRDAGAAVAFLAGEAGRLVAVGDRDVARFQAEVAARGLAVAGHGTVSGFNYSRGRRVALTLYRIAP